VTAVRRRSSALAVAVLVGAALAASPGSGRGQRVAVSPCVSRVQRGVLPVWARAGFSSPRPTGPYVLSARGKLAALLWADPLLSPRPRDHNNKILWVSRVTTVPGSDLRISAQRMSGSTPIGAPVPRRVSGGPGPSIVNLPAPGCWRFTLRWSGQVDSIDLVYRSNHA
jgi:hypothetical protein